MESEGGGDAAARASVVHDMQAGLRPQVEDVPRAAKPDEPPAPGAQWDEVHRRWEQWDEVAGAWVVVGDVGDGVPPGEEQLMPPSLARTVVHADDLDLRDEPEVIDVRRVPEPPEQVPGAQWNEVAARWERWDDATGAWEAVEG